MSVGSCLPFRLLSGLVLGGLALAALAQTPPSAPAAAASAPELSAICTDRPTKSNAACVVDTGHFQYETDLVNASHQKQNGATTDVYLLTNPTLKYGIAKDVDVEVNIAPWEIVRLRDASGQRTTLHGVGDLYVRAKWNFWNSGDGAVAVAALPYVKFATAKSGIGNRATEGGFLLPVNIKLSDKLTLTTVPEFDSLKNSNDFGRHFNTAQLVNLAYSLPNNVTVYGELWTDWNHDPAGIVRQYSADAAVAWGLSNTLQVDAGINFGLNPATPRVQGYVGVSQKF